MRNRHFIGVGTSPGLAVGQAYIIRKKELVIPKGRVNKINVNKEVTRLKRAILKSKEELLNLKNSISENISEVESKILSAQILILEDKVTIKEMIYKIKKERKNAEWALNEVFNKVTETLSTSNNGYLRERTADIVDIQRMILFQLLKMNSKSSLNIKNKIILIAQEISSSDVMSLMHMGVIGFVTEGGGKFSHTSIIARALEIPAVIGVQNITKFVRDGETIVVNGENGEVYINPKRDILLRCRHEIKRQQQAKESIDELRELHAETIDGYSVELAANIEFPSEVDIAIKHGAYGIGLFRTEFLRIGRKTFPTEEEQYIIYRDIANRIAPHPFIIRTFDFEGDQVEASSTGRRETNPSLGWRAIRFCLIRKDIFMTQLRAILRASTLKNVKVMIPMISTFEEMREVNQIIDGIKKELKKQYIDYDEDCQVGAMIEVPSAALTCDILAKEVQFFSIGSNDLTQYTLAVDRSNERVAVMFDNYHPGVLRLIKNIIDTGKKSNIWVSMCGEMASEPMAIPLLLGMGLDSFSMLPSCIPMAKKIVKSLSFSETKDLAQIVLSLSTSSQIKDTLADFLKKKNPAFENLLKR